MDNSKLTESKDVNLLMTTTPESSASTDENNNQNNDFVNHGLRNWEETRASWLNYSTNSNDNSSVDSNTDSTLRAAIPVDVDDIIDLVFSQRWRSQEPSQSMFPQPVPLPQMVDILVDLWEAEGLDI